LTTVETTNIPIITPTINAERIVVITTSHERSAQELKGARLQGLSFLSSLHYYQSGREILIFEQPTVSSNNVLASLPRELDARQSGLGSGGFFWL
jgi:hypothetical protein